MEHHEPEEVTPRLTIMSLPSKRADIAAAEEMKMDEIPNLEKLISSDIVLPAGEMELIGESSLSFVKLSANELPRVDYAVKIHPSMCYEILWREALLEPNAVLPDKDIPDKISTFTFLQKLVSALDKMEGPFTEEKLINNLVDKIEDLGKGDRKTNFLCEQLRLSRKHPYASTYSQEVQKCWTNLHSRYLRLMCLQPIMCRGTFRDSSSNRHLAIAVKTCFQTTKNTFRSMQTKLWPVVTLLQKENHLLKRSAEEDL